MSQDHQIIAGVTLHVNRPTDVAFRELFTWTIWQFPRKKAGGLLGAVHPPIAGHGWFPAVIHAKDKHTQVHGHLEKSFDTPEDAAEHLGSTD